MTMPGQTPDNQYSPTTSAAWEPAPTTGHGQQIAVTPQYATQQKSKTMALVLLLLFGGLGVHNFYLGHNGRGIVELSLTILGWLTLVFIIGAVFLVIVGIWVFIELFQTLLGGDSVTDANGLPLA